MTIGRVHVRCAGLAGLGVDAIDRLARLELAARRSDLELRLDDVDPRLVELIQLCGLAGVLRVEPRRQTE